MKKICVAYGDGIGPEITTATIRILQAARVDLQFIPVEMGEKLYLAGHRSGIDSNVWSALKDNKILLKGPMTTPKGKGYKSINVTLRKALGLYANIRPNKTYDFLHADSSTGQKPQMDLVIVRENEEDLYAGIEYLLTGNSAVSLKLISRLGSAKIIRYAFEYAVKNNRSRATCVTKSNIMKIADGSFLQIFNEIAQEYPTIIHDDQIVDISSALISNKPEKFDVVVTLNLYGDIMSDIAAEVSGSVGLAGSANIGDEYSLFEAVHGSAPDIAGKNIANPSGLINAAVMLLRHMGIEDKASLIEDAWSNTLREGIHTADIYKKDGSKALVGTKEFADAVIDKMSLLEGKQLSKGASSSVADSVGNALRVRDNDDAVRYGYDKDQGILSGYDIFIRDVGGYSFDDIASNVIQKTGFELSAVGHRGLLIWPKIDSDKHGGDLLQLRFQTKDKSINGQDALVGLVGLLFGLGLSIAAMCALYQYDDGRNGFSDIQGQE